MAGFFPLLLQVSVKILMMMMMMAVRVMMVVVMVVILKVWHQPPNIVSLLEKRHLKSHVPQIDWCEGPAQLLDPSCNNALDFLL